MEISNMTSDSEERTVSVGCINSPSIEEVSTGGNAGGGGPLKKGPWTSAEDAILVDYVNKHGEGNWNAVQKHSGLSRCGKSCRLRWANHLRPDLKKGSFTADEERRIIELHAKMGNKWARMAVELPGRTDNEIKNFWNTRTKRRQRMGLPIYPPDICLQALNENQQSQNMVTFPNGDTAHSEIMQNNNLEIPAVEFKNLELNQDLFPSAVLDIPGSSLLDVPGNSLLAQGLSSSCGNSFLLPVRHPHKRIRRSETYPCFGVDHSDVMPTADQYQDDTSEKISQSFELSSSSSYNHSLNSDLPSSSYLLPGSHAFLNGNSSSSEPISWAMKLELPSLQYSNQVNSWGTPSSPLPSLESVDTLFNSPVIEQTKSESLSPRNNGLLETVIYESRTLKIPKSNDDSCQHTSNDAAMPTDIADSSSPNLHEAEWEIYGDPISPLGPSAASVFSEYTPISGSSIDEHQSVETMPVKHEGECVSKQSESKYDIQNHIDYSRPDFLLGSNWFGSSTEGSRDHSLLTDAIGVLLGEDVANECKQNGALDATPVEGHGSCKWDDIPTICQLSGND